MRTSLVRHDLVSFVADLFVNLVSFVATFFVKLVSFVADPLWTSCPSWPPSS